MKNSRVQPLTAQQQADILQLYVKQQLPGAVTAQRLHLSVVPVFEFLRVRGVLRPLGYFSRKLGAAQLEQLKRELPTTRDIVLARRYGLTRERIRQIRQQRGGPTSRALQKHWSAQRRQQKQLAERRAQQLRQRQRRAQRLAAINRLSARWKAGALVAELARKEGITWAALLDRIVEFRKEFPEKFPHARDLARIPHSPRWQRLQRVLARQARQRRAKQLPSINRLSRRWKAGESTSVLAQDCGINRVAMAERIKRWRKLYPEKFPFRPPYCLPYLDRLSYRWKSGSSTLELAQEFGRSHVAMKGLISRLRKRYPDKFPLRRQK